MRSIAMLFCLLCQAVVAADPGWLSKIKLPSGFHIQVFAEVPGARGLAVSSSGTVFVASAGWNEVIALRDEDGDGRADRQWPVTEDLRRAHGVAFGNGDLFVSDIDQVRRFPSIETRLDQPHYQVIARLPAASHHGTRDLAFGPDGKLYVALGVPCNICLDEGFDDILRMDPDGGNREVFASGIRNSVGMDWHPGSGVLWFTDNGRDWLGDDLPPDELNRAPRKGLHFGFPWCHGGEVPDPEFGKRRGCDRFVPPALKLQAHVAPLGLHFYRGTAFPPEYRKRLFVALHGSWNRSLPVGYKLMMASIEDCRVVAWQTFAKGWLRRDGKRLGRPVDIAGLPDGSLLVSDDGAGLIYRISYRPGGS